MRDLDELTQTLSNWMPRLDNVQPLLLTNLAPLQVARCSHQCSEDLGEVAGVQHDKPHARQHPCVHPLHYLVADLAVRHVPPPHQDVSVVQHILSQAVLRLIKGGGSGLEALRREELSNSSVNTPRIQGRDLGIGLFVSELIPDGDSDRTHCSVLLSLS